MCLRVPLLSVDKVREFGRVTDEENWGVIEDPIPVTFLSPEFDGETTRVTSGVGGSGFTTDGGEAGGNTDLLSDTLEEGLGGDVAQVMGDFKVSVGTYTLGVDLQTLALTYRLCRFGEGVSEDLRHALGYAHGRSGQGDRCGGNLGADQVTDQATQTSIAPWRRRGPWNPAL